MLDAYAAGQDGQTRLTLLSTWLGHVHPASTYWYLSASAGAVGRCRAAARNTPRGPTGRPTMSALASTLQAFFTDQLVRQRQVSPNTIAAYRDTLRLLLTFTSQQADQHDHRVSVMEPFGAHQPRKRLTEHAPGVRPGRSEHP